MGCIVNELRVRSRLLMVIGAIIPKIEVRDYIPDPSLPKQPANPITIHVYPGKDNVSTRLGQTIFHGHTDPR